MCLKWSGKEPEESAKLTFYLQISLATIFKLKLKYSAAFFLPLERVVSEIWVQGKGQTWSFVHKRLQLVIEKKTFNQWPTCSNLSFSWLQIFVFVRYAQFHQKYDYTC